MESAGRWNHSRAWIVPLPSLWSCMARSVADLRCQEIGCAVVATRISAPQDSGPGLPRRESHHPGRAPKPKSAPVNPTFGESRVVLPKRGGAPPASPAPSPDTSANQLDPTSIVAVLRSLELSEDLLAQVRAAFPPQLRGPTDSAKVSRRSVGEIRNSPSFATGYVRRELGQEVDRD